MTVNSNGNVDSYNDYYPFGMQMPNRNQAGTADGRFKFTGKEQDVETTLDYFGARYYDSWRGQWLRVDPLASKYPGWSPYNYGMDNSIRNIDPNGMDLSDFYDENGNLTKHVDDKSNAVYQEEGRGQQEHYEFTGFDESQGGEDIVDLGTAIQEAQNLNMSNPALQEDAKGTYCNVATQDVLKTVGSALGINLSFAGSVASMESEILQSGYFRRTDESTAAPNATSSLSLVVHLGSLEHIASFSSGENVSKGLIANIGPKDYTGFKSMNEAINSARSKEYFILDLKAVMYSQLGWTSSK